MCIHHLHIDTHGSVLYTNTCASYMCDWAYENRAYLHTKICLILNLNLQYLLKYKSYDNEISILYSQINRKARKVHRT